LNKKTARILVASSLLLSFGAFAQNNTLLEACNSIDDKEKRFSCLQEIAALKSVNSHDANSFKRLKAAFSGIAGAVSAGISYKNYQSMIADPAKELGIFKQESSNINPQALTFLDRAVSAYNDAERLWRASIFESRDGGILFGKILNYQSLGLSDVIRTYNLPTTTVLMNPHVSVQVALPIIWQYAEKTAKLALDDIQGKKKIDTREEWEVHSEDLLNK